MRTALEGGSLTMLESWFRAMSRTVAGLTLTPEQCERVADEIRDEILARTPAAEDYRPHRRPA